VPQSVRRIESNWFLFQRLTRRARRCNCVARSDPRYGANGEHRTGPYLIAPISHMRTRPPTLAPSPSLQHYANSSIEDGLSSSYRASRIRALSDLPSPSFNLRYASNVTHKSYTQNSMFIVQRRQRVASRRYVARCATIAHALHRVCMAALHNMPCSFSMEQYAGWSALGMW
jgi:hypothetical protein